MVGDQSVCLSCSLGVISPVRHRSQFLGLFIPERLFLFSQSKSCKTNVRWGARNSFKFSSSRQLRGGMVDYFKQHQ